MTPYEENMNQEVRVKLDVSLTVNCRYGTEELREMIERGVREAFPDKWKYIHELRYAEERHIYHSKNIRWQTIMAKQSDYDNSREQEESKVLAS
jgi:hypothetical protein